MRIEARPWRIAVWQVLVLVRNRRSEVADFIDGLPPKLQKKLFALVERIATSANGPFDIKNDQKFKRLEENLYEIKTVVANGFLKKSRRAPEAELTRARTLRHLYQEANPL